jgi:hypothetical protein
MMPTNLIALELIDSGLHGVGASTVCYAIEYIHIYVVYFLAIITSL